MNYETLIAVINRQEAMRILSIKMGKYSQFCNAYETVLVEGKRKFRNPGLKNSFDSQMMPILEHVCGNELGENPHDPRCRLQQWRKF